jgi:hypothetical protein
MTTKNDTRKGRKSFAVFNRSNVAGPLHQKNFSNTASDYIKSGVSCTSTWSDAGLPDYKVATFERADEGKSYLAATSPVGELCTTCTFVSSDDNKAIFRQYLPSNAQKGDETFLESANPAIAENEETESNELPNSIEPISPLSILLTICDALDNHTLPRRATFEEAEIPSNDPIKKINRTIQDFETSDEQEIIFEANGHFETSESRGWLSSPCLSTKQKSTNPVDVSKMENSTTPKSGSVRNSIFTMARRLTPRGDMNRDRFHTEEPMTDFSENEDDEEIDEESNTLEAVDTDLHESETVVAKNTAKRIDVEQEPDRNAKSSILSFMQLWKSEEQRETNRLGRRKNSSRQKKERNCQIALNMGNVLVALLVFTEIIVLSTIGTAYLGSTIALHSYNLTSSLQQAGYQMESNHIKSEYTHSEEDEGKYNENNNHTIIMSSPCEPHQILFQFTIKFDTKPAQVGINLEELNGSDGTGIWRFEPDSSFQSSKLSESTNIFSICLSRFPTYRLEISDTNCDGLISSVWSEDVVFGKWNVQYDQVPIVEYNGNCSATSSLNDTSTHVVPLLMECGSYNKCVYTISDSGIFGYCDTSTCSKADKSKTTRLRNNA